MTSRRGDGNIQPQVDRVAEARRVLGSLRIDRSSTAERVADALRELIMRGEMPPGMPLREHQLVELLDVSRNTIREAFRLLSRERLVVHHLHRGVAVRQLDEDDIHDIFRTRRPIELMAIEYSATAPRRSLLELLALVEQAEEAADRDDWEHVATMDIVFHQRLVELIGSERISAFFRIVHTELRLVFGIVERPPDLFARFVPRNRRLAELLLAGERATATSELEAYLDEGERLLTRGVRVLFSGSDAVDS